MTIVDQVMTHNPITAEIPGSRNDVLKLMVRHNLTGLPIIKKADGSLAGMVTRSTNRSLDRCQLTATVPRIVSSDASAEVRSPSG